MININELRVGNYFYHEDKCIKLDANLLIYFLKNDNYLSLKKVPLVSKMLEEFGFLKINGWDDQIYYRYFDFMILECDGYFEYEIKKIKYLHELQNLYSSIAEELRTDNLKTTP